jgi:hypothetical protein
MKNEPDFFLHISTKSCKPQESIFSTDDFESTILPVKNLSYLNDRVGIVDRWFAPNNRRIYRWPQTLVCTLNAEVGFSLSYVHTFVGSFVPGWKVSYFSIKFRISVRILIHS